MSIKISNTVRKSLSRAVFCLLILLPMGAAMAASKSAPKPNPFMQNPAQPGYVGPYTTQNDVATPGSLAAPAMQSAAAASTSDTNTKTATANSKTSKNAAGGGRGI